MNVFVPGYGYDYDGDSAAGVYRSYESAFDRLVRNTCYKHSDGSYHISGDYWYIMEWTLDVDKFVHSYSLSSEDVLKRFKELEQD